MRPMPLRMEQILGVSTDATDRSIKRAYRQLALKLHPDKLGHEPSEDEHNQFIEIARAYEILSDPERRKKYDNDGDEGNSAAAVAHVYHGKHFNLFVRVPGAAFQFKYKPPATPKVQPIIVHVPVELGEIYSGNGTVKTQTVKRTKFCSHCHGTGAASSDHLKHCDQCSGTGLFSKLYAHASGYSHVVQIPCKTCARTGKTIEVNCPVCNGTRYKDDQLEVNVTVPAGAPNGFQMEMEGEGSQRLHHKDGDVFFIVQHKPHPKMFADNNRPPNLIYTAQISLIDALAGFRKYIVMPDNSKVEVVRETVTMSGHQETFPDKGLPDVKDKEKKGSLVVIFRVIFPKQLSAQQRVVLREVLGDEQLSVIEDMIQVAVATEMEATGSELQEEELLYSTYCDLLDQWVCPNQQIVRYRILFEWEWDSVFGEL